MYPVIDPIQTGANIARLRKAAGLTIRELQDGLGVTAQAVHKWQVGAALPTVDNLVVLAAMLRVRIDDILVTKAA